MFNVPAPKFLAFTIKHNGRANRIITDVRLSQAFDPNKAPNPGPPLYDTKALWDTGATGSVVTRATASALGLTPVGSTLVNHAGGSSQSNSYVVNVFLPNSVAIPGIMVSECQDIMGGTVGAIIGMDIISHGDFAITNVSGLTWMTFRIPSTSTVDYVGEFEKVRFLGASRNQPCPCGKKNSQGRPVKFKYCHGA